MSTKEREHKEKTKKKRNQTKTTKNWFNVIIQNGCSGKKRRVEA